MVSAEQILCGRWRSINERPDVGESLGVLADYDWCREKVDFWEKTNCQIDGAQLDDELSDNIV